jgi:FdhD protein
MKDKTPAILRTNVLRCVVGLEPKRHADALAREEPLEIRVRGRSIAVTMRTPGHDDELAAGFLFTEGMISRRQDIVGVGQCLESDAPENTLNVFLAPKVEVDFDRLTRHVFASSSCGVCGKASIESVHQHFPPLRAPASLPAGRGRQQFADGDAGAPRIRAAILAELPARMSSGQRAFARTGGLHAAAIFDAGGRMMVLREDVGRHNAVDKVIGHGFLKGKLPFASHILAVSGRASFEIVQKALAARIPIICAISAPSSLAVEFARESGQTLVGFLRGRTMNVYSCPERLAW